MLTFTNHQKTANQNCDEVPLLELESENEKTSIGKDVKLECSCTAGAGDVNGVLAAGESYVAPQKVKPRITT